MKKLSLFLMALVAVTTISAKVVTFDFASADFLTSVGVKAPANDQDATNLTTMTFEGVTLTFTKVATTDNRIWNSKGALDLRMYKTSYVTLSCDENIMAIELFGAATTLFNEAPTGSWVGESKSVKLTANGTAKLTKMVVTVGEKPIVWTPDTISVDSAITLIGKGDTHTHYVVGVVDGSPWQANGKWPGLATCNMRDAEGKTETLLQAYNIGNKAADTWFKSQEDADSILALGDTIMVFANNLSFYEAKKLNEINGGYYVKTIGKSQMIDATTIFPYGYGAIVGEVVDNKYHFDVVLTRTEEYDIKNALHLGIVSSKEKGINGSYSLFAESSHIDGEPATPISGSVKFEWKKMGESWNVYQVKAAFTAGELNYRIDGLYELPAVWLDEQGEEVDAANLDDDIPYQPNEGDTITCEQALSYAKGLGEDVSPIKVYIRGWVVSKPTTSSSNMSQRNFYINDDPKASSGIAQSYYCYEQGLDSIVKGNEVLLYGNILLYNGVAEIKNGQIYRLTGTEQHYRDIQCVEAKSGAISVAQAMEIGMALEATPGQTVETSSEYTVIGYIAKVSYQTKNDTATWFMTDDQESTFGDLQAYKCYIPALITHGDKVMITGKIAKYVKDDGSKTTIEFRYSKGEFVCQVPSDNEEIEAVEKADGKFILNGRFLIRYKNDWYNAQGDHYRR